MTGHTQISNEQLSVSVSALGAEMQSLQDARGRDYLWHGDAAYWGGRSPILFPIVGRAPDDTITVEGHSALMAQHGFARRSLFTLRDAGRNYCTHAMTDSAATRAVYPFAFRLSVTHRVRGAGVRISARVENLDTRPMPFGLGFHPAFCWPLPGCEGQPHRIMLNNAAAPDMARLRGGLLPAAHHPSPFENGVLTLDQSLFAEDAMIFPEGAGTGLTYGAGTGTTLRFAFENLPNLALWTKPGAPFICIEPWHGMAAREGASGEISERPYSVLLPAGAVQEFTLSVSFPALSGKIRAVGQI
ncbi:aldose 1-epimerase family protein [Thalassovita taeanensis]|uniref:Galactose mutarotase n=1 Tax=Thalassovita taeanensis TaxID=657014 RepID=A0A1H9L232_9RHOB|nr:aldose 1-epimerase family protein [Thalassovita taeanensis]SER05522.1 Galactose mutarotase [Thalassovita taeanensis]